MPNGRSGGFVIELAELKQLVQSLASATAVGKIVRSSQLRPVNAGKVARIVEDCKVDRVAVEEQDHRFYVIRLPNEPEAIRLMVGSETPLFLELQQRHAQWMNEHPGWNGWVAF